MLICRGQIREDDAETILKDAGQRFFFVIGKRDDQRLRELIPFSENTLILDGICFFCKGVGSFSCVNNKVAICRGCKSLQKERVKAMDERMKAR